MIKHSKYQSIESNYRLLYIKEIKREFVNKNPQQKYVVTEKVDGSNVQVYFSIENEMKIGRRSGFVQKNKKQKWNFFPKAVDWLISYFGPFAQKILEIVKNEIENEVKWIIVYGELYGGFFKGMEKNNGSVKIQGRISYFNTNWFYPFDIGIKSEKEEYFVSYQIFEKIMKSISYKIYAQPLFIGNYEKCMDFNVSFDSKIPKLHNMPNLEGNLCEGVVIKPYNTVVFTTKGRLIIKKKNKDYFEIQKPRSKFGVPKMSKKLRNLWEKLEKYITVQRVFSVASKIGNTRFMEELILNLMDDSLGDAQKDFNWKIGLNEKEIKKIKGVVNRKSAYVVAKYLDETK